MIKIIKKISALLTFLLVVTSAFSEIKYELTVAQDGSGDFTTIQAAINASKAFPDKRITINIKNGVYREKVKVHAWNNLLTLRGESKDKTIITYDDYFSKIDLGRNSTFYTYTLMIDADDCIVQNLTVINSSGPVGQAVALHIEKDRCQIVDCKILGYQDTVYAAGEGSRQYFLRCFIDGSVDFIFGAATALFEDCIINSKANSYVTAASTFKGAEFGYVFKDCKLTADQGVDKVYLGRPWRIYAKTVYVSCELGDHILPEGWHNWNKKDAERYAFYAEYNCSGAGYKPLQRCSWSKQLTKKQVGKYTKENIFNDWLPMVK